MDISFGDQKVKINILNASKYTQKEKNYSVVEIIDEIVESNASIKLIKDDFLDEPIEKIQVQEVNTLFDSPHPPYPLEFINPIFDMG